MPIPEECPGSKFAKQPVPKDITCPNCKESLEVWSDELFVECSNCKCKISSSGEVENSCVNWCNFAEKCVGTELYDEITSKSKNPSDTK